MIGLEYILNIYNLSYADLAGELGIVRQNLNMWIKGKRKIPDSQLDKLSLKFNLPKEYFQMIVAENKVQEVLKLIEEYKKQVIINAFKE